MDKEVIAFLEKKEVILFFEHITSVINMSVSNYLERDFTNLAINFGCTGGQHRSVYFAEKLANYLKNKYSIKIIVTHTAENNWEK